MIAVLLGIDSENRDSQVLFRRFSFLQSVTARAIMGCNGRSTVSRKILVAKTVSDGFPCRRRWDRIYVSQCIASSYKNVKNR